MAQIQRRIEARLAPIVVVRGSRQIGKSTAQEQVIEQLLSSGVPRAHVLRVQFDDLPWLSKLGDEPILRTLDWFERQIVGQSINQIARDGGRVFLFLDEIQNIAGWDVQLKMLVDHTAVQIVVTGSSALRIERGRDSLAGRISTLEAGTLTLTEIAAFRGLDLGGPALPDNDVGRLLDKGTWLDLARRGQERAEARGKAFAAFSEVGGYPIAHVRHAQAVSAGSGEGWPESWALLADQLNETIVRRVIQHDLRVGSRGRKRDEALLEELFRLVCRNAGQAPRPLVFAQELHRVLGANIGVQRVQSYLRFLSETLLVRLVQPLEIRLQKQRAPAKLCLADHSLRASWLQEVIPLDSAALAEASEPVVAQAGRLAESVVGALLATV
ncbi:MAG: AAA family ATPase, partial [Myxococcales bacterium]|nr:AAA family ATPase [Myxococcales bacterium]